MVFSLNLGEKRKISEHFGSHFLERVEKDLKIYAKKWNLEIVEIVDYYSVNCIFICKNEMYGDVILKICPKNSEVHTEISALMEYNGDKFCKIFHYELDNGVILEERIVPGIQLRDEKSLEKKLSVFSKLFNGLHKKSRHHSAYPTYTEWVNRITEYMSRRSDYVELYQLMKKARDTHSEVAQKYNREMLLHGDLHHDNILLNSDGQYKVIDPKGVIGDPILDVPRFILNEYDDSIDKNMMTKKINYIIDFFEDSLKIPKDIIRKCYFVETSMAHCWCVESNEAPDVDAVKIAEFIAFSQRP